jgi:hypothetical protein
MVYYPGDEEWDEGFGDEDEGCDYGLSEWCEYPDLKDLDCDVNCPLYLESLKELEEVECS